MSCNECNAADGRQSAFGFLPIPGFTPPPVFFGPAELDSKQWLYWGYQPGEGWVHVITMPAMLPVAVADGLVIASLNPEAVTALDRGLFDRATGKYEQFVRLFP
jgi:hypothetical protein